MRCSLYFMNLLHESIHCQRSLDVLLRRSGKPLNSQSPSGERNEDKSTKKRRQRASISGKKDKSDDVTMMTSSSSANQRHSAPLPAESSQTSSVVGSLHDLSHSTTSAIVRLIGYTVFQSVSYTHLTLPTKRIV